ncbi:MAG: DUF4129 domain-containing protein [Bryobacteraceae bacterium]
MKRDTVRPGAIELIEEASHLVRRAPASVLAAYYVGTLPFLFGLLYFWSDMTGHAFASERLGGASLLTALLYQWMSVWQAVYTTGLRRELAGSSPRWTPGRVARLIAIQCAVQPTGLLLMPAGSLLILPLAWLYAFYQNITAMGDGTDSSWRRTLARAKAQASLWPRQAWLAMLIQSGFALFVLVNIAFTLILVPQLAQSYLGIESTFTRSGASVLNTTFLAIALSLTYLCVDPLVKAIYLLRCFYGESLGSGEDLKVAMRWKSALTTAALALALLAGAGAAGAQAPQPRANAGPIVASDLDREIDRVIHQRRYAWRLPREAPQPNRSNAFVRFSENVWTTLQRGLMAALRAIDKLVDWLGELLWRRSRGAPPMPGTGGGLPTGLRVGIYLVLAALAGALIVLLWRSTRRARASVVQASAVQAQAIDLTREDVSAAQLPEEGWLALARDWIGRNDFRMAVRALYLASLAWLGQREFVRIHRGKSNLEYRRELERRARALPGLLTAFETNVAVFEGCWYGDHTVDRETVDRFAGNLERMKAHAG